MKPNPKCPKITLDVILAYENFDYDSDKQIYSSIFEESKKAYRW